MALDENATFLIACISETLGYGIAIILFINSTQTLLKKKKLNENLNLPIFIASPILFFFSTLHIFGVWVRTYKAFVTYPQGPIAYWGLITSTEKTITQVGQVGAVILADLMTVYRTLMIWQLNYWVIIIPSITFIGTIVGAAGFITTQHKVNVHTSIFSTTVTQWTEAWLACSLVTTGLCTIAIIYKLLSVQHKLGVTGAFASSRSLTTRVLRIFVESAALYSINNLLYAVLYSVKISEEAWFSGLDAPIASITFSLIIIRVESAVNAPLTRRSKMHTLGTSDGSTDVSRAGRYPSYIGASRAREVNLKPSDSLIVSHDAGLNEHHLKTQPSRPSGEGSAYSPYDVYNNPQLEAGGYPPRNEFDEPDRTWSNRATAPTTPARSGLGSGDGISRRG